MTEPAPSSPSPGSGEPRAPIVKRARRRPSSVWLIPIVATLLGLWLVYDFYTSQGPLVEVRFETAEGLVAQKTEVRCRSVKVGTVAVVQLSDDLDSVIVTIRMDLKAKNLVREDTRFWVVRPRVGASGISGLETIVSGAYIELSPGVSTIPARVFTGREQPPVTPQGVPGIHVALEADEAGSLGPGALVTCKGIEVGRVESLSFDAASRRVSFGVFIDAPHDALVTANTRFWNASGISAQVGATGVSVETGSLQSLLAGGVSFDVPSGLPSGPLVEDGAVFRLYENYRSINEAKLDLRLAFLLLFEDSVRGLAEGAPVEFRGLRVGTVGGISLESIPPSERVAGQIPVLVRLDPGALAGATAIGAGADREMVARLVRDGLRASLKTGSLLTGQLFVDLDFHEDAAPAEVVAIADLDVLPTRTSGFAHIEERLVGVLEKIEALPVERTLETATDAIAGFGETAKRLQGAVESLDALISSEPSKNLPGEISAALEKLRETLDSYGDDSVLYGELYRTVEELRDAIRNVNSLAGSLERKPNALIFGKPSNKVTPPRAKN